MSRMIRSLIVVAAAAVMACGVSGPARAGGLASLCAEYETRTVVGIIEDLLTEVDDCVRVAAAPDDSPRPVPRPVLLAAAPPTFVPLTSLVTAAIDTPALIGSGGRVEGRGRPPFVPVIGGGGGIEGGGRLPLAPVIGGGDGEPTGSTKVEKAGRNPVQTDIEVPAVPLPGSGLLLGFGLLAAAGVRAAHRRRHPFV